MGDTEAMRIAQEGGRFGAREAVLELVSNQAALTKIAIDAQKWYSVADIAAITGYSNLYQSS